MLFLKYAVSLSVSQT
jgi:hypothetical protein